MDTLYQVKANDLIVNITFAWEGAVAIVKPEDEHCLVSHRFPTYEIDLEKADPDFVRYIIQTRRFTELMGIISPGGAGRNRVLNKKDFLEQKVWLPDLKTQKFIGDLLCKAEEDINVTLKLLATYKSQKRGLMQKLLTGEWRVQVDKEAA
jgi:type I restriction enzyme S subunit